MASNSLKLSIFVVIMRVGRENSNKYSDETDASYQGDLFYIKDNKPMCLDYEKFSFIEKKYR